MTMRNLKRYLILAIVVMDGMLMVSLLSSQLHGGGTKGPVGGPVGEPPMKEPPKRPLPVESPPAPGLLWWQKWLKENRYTFRAPCRRWRVYQSPEGVVIEGAVLGSETEALLMGVGEQWRVKWSDHSMSTEPIKVSDRPVDYNMEQVVGLGRTYYGCLLPEGRPRVLKVGVLRADSRVFRWQDPKDLPTAVRQRLYWAWLPAVKFDPDDVSENELKAALPLFRGVWEVVDTQGRVVAKARVPKGLTVGYGVPVAVTVGQDFCFPVRTLPTSVDWKSISEPDLEVMIGDTVGNWGYTRSHAGVFRVRKGKGPDEGVEVRTFSPEDRPDLPFLSPLFRGEQTFAPRIWPGWGAVVYTWRGVAGWEDPRQREKEEGLINLPAERLDVVVLLLALRDGRQVVIDFQVGYAKRVVPPTEVGPPEVPAPLEYVWQPDGNGEILERTVIPDEEPDIRMFLENESSPAFAWQAMALRVMDFSPQGYLLYQKGSELWLADVRAELVTETEHKANP